MTEKMDNQAIAANRAHVLHVYMSRLSNKRMHHRMYIYIVLCIKVILARVRTKRLLDTIYMFDV